MIEFASIAEARQRLFHHQLVRHVDDYFTHNKERTMKTTVEQINYISSLIQKEHIHVAECEQDIFEARQNIENLNEALRSLEIVRGEEKKRFEAQQKLAEETLR